MKKIELGAVIVKRDSQELTIDPGSNTFTVRIPDKFKDCLDDVGVGKVRIVIWFDKS